MGGAAGAAADWGSVGFSVTGTEVLVAVVVVVMAAGSTLQLLLPTSSAVPVAFGDVAAVLSAIATSLRSLSASPLSPLSSSTMAAATPT